MKTKCRVGKKIMALVVYRRRNIGVIQSLDNTTVQVYSDKNPKGYKHYELSKSDFDTWVNKKLYVLRW